MQAISHTYNNDFINNGSVNLKKNFVRIFNVFFFVFCSSAQASTKEDMLQFLDLFSEDAKSVYVLEGKIESIEGSIEVAAASISTGDITDKEGLATLLTNELAKVDKHFSVSVYQSFDSKQETATESYWHRLRRKNSGFQSVQILEGNIGFLNLTGFDKVDTKSMKRAKVAMAFISDVDSLIIDLRENGGGSPDMVSVLVGYFFENEVELSSIYERASDTTIEFASEQVPKDLRRPQMPLYLLTSNDTFSAAEAFSYDLQHYEKAIVVGERTGGGANPVRTYFYDEGFAVAIPYAKAINPVTGSNWEGVGVKPDVEVSAEKAFKKAYCLALKDQAGNSFTAPRSLDAKRQIDSLNCG